MTESRDALTDALAALTATEVMEASPERLRARRDAGAAIRRAMKSGPVAPVVRTIPLVRGPVPRKAALGATVKTHAPFVMVRHRALLVQCLSRGSLRTLLWNPTDVRHALSIPAFDPLRHGPGKLVADMLLHTDPPVPFQIASLGILADTVDLLAYDQLDAQYPSAMLARFPRARMAVSQSEWERIDRPKPRDAAFIVHGPEIDRGRVHFIDDHWVVGDGVVLVRTGGRRPGHVALLVHCARGLFVASGNALSLDGYVPAASPLPGFAKYAAKRRLAHLGAYPDVGQDPTEAMATEYAMADRHPDVPLFPFVIPTVELFAHPIAPGIHPGAVAPDLTLGTVVRA